MVREAFGRDSQMDITDKIHQGGPILIERE